MSEQNIKSNFTSLTMINLMPKLRRHLPLFFLTSLVLLASSVSSKSEFLKQCLQSCPRDVQLLDCQKECVMQDLEKHREGGVPEEETGISAQEEYQQCQQWCDEKEYEYPRQLKQCRKHCEERLREREAEEAGGRGGETGRDPIKQLRHCQRECINRYGTAQERQICKRTCRKQYDLDVGYESPHDHDVVDDLEEVPPGKHYERCMKSCQRQSQDRQQRQKCECQCQKGPSSQKEPHSKEEEESWESNSIVNKNVRYKFKKCLLKCEEHSQETPEQMTKCQQRCEEKYGCPSPNKKQGQECTPLEEINKGKEKKNPKGSETEEERTINNPCHFPSDESHSLYSSQDGQLKVFDIFSTKSKVLQGIENYRFAVLEAGPNTFVIPHHCDAESVMVVVRGKGTISLVSQKRRKSYNIEFGDVIGVPAGTTVYLINQGNYENLEIAKLILSGYIPGLFMHFFLAGGQHPQSYLRAFSTHLLYQVLNVTRDQVDRLLGHESKQQWQGQRQTIAIRASPQQLRALSHNAYSSPDQIIDDSNSKGPIRLGNQKPIYSNAFGRILEANPEDHIQIRDLNAFINLVEINQGAIMVPHHNTKSTVVGFVVGGSGDFEMICPHLSSHGMEGGDDDGENSNKLQVNRASLAPGDVFVVPVGHPISYIPHPGQNLKFLEFGINGLNNQRNFIAGKDSIVMKMETEAKKLGFNVGGAEAEQILSSQKLSYFVPNLETAQQERQGGEKHNGLVRVLDYVEGLF